MSFSTILFTEKGRALQAKATAGTALVFTKIVMGSGYLNGQSQITLTNMIEPKVTVSISEIKRTGQQATIKGNFTNADEAVGFYWREIGLFATDPDLGEILYCYGNAGVLAEYIPPESSSLIEKVISIAAVVGNASSVSAVVDPLVYATKKDMADMSVNIENVNLQLEQIEIKKANLSDISNLASATPVIVSSTSNMTDITKIYVLDSTMEIYQWVSGAITSTGKYYNASVLADKSIHISKLDDITSANFSKENKLLGNTVNNIIAQDVAGYGFRGWSTYVLNNSGILTKIIVNNIKSNTESYTLYLDILDVNSNLINSKSISVTNGIVSQNINFVYSDLDLSSYSVLKIRLYANIGVGISFGGTSNVNTSFVTSYNGYNAAYMSKNNTTWDNANNYIPNISIYVLNVGLDLSKKISNADVIDIKNNLIKMRDIVGWSSPNSLSVSDISVSFSPVSSSDDSGIITNSITPSGGIYVTIKLQVSSSLLSPISKPSLSLFNTSGSYVATLAEELEYGDNTLRFDPDYYAIYYGLSSFKLVIASIADPTTTGVITISDFIVYQSKLDALEIYGTSLDDILVKINNKLTTLDSSVEQLSEKSPELSVASPSGNKFFIQINDDGSFSSAKQIPSKTLFIGNSLLVGWSSDGSHGTPFGICATDNSHDYYYYVNSKITELNNTYVATKHEGFTWEGYTTLSDQNTWLNSVLLPLLASDLDLVIVQLGDNINSDARLAVFEQGAKNMLKFIRQNCPNARVVWVGEWYSTSTKQTYIANACIDTGSIFIDISDLNITANQGLIGDKITYADATTTSVTLSGQANHPGNLGMLAIANRICYKLGITNNEAEITV